MKKLLLGTALAASLLLSIGGANAVVIGNLGVNPNSSQGDFNNSPAGQPGAFADQYTFQLVGGPQFITVASVTNVFPNTTDFITNFTLAVYQQVGAVGGGDDIAIIGPVAAVPCALTPNCQTSGGSALLNPGNFYLELAGNSGGTSGYGGNLSTRAVPGPIIGAGLPGLLMACGGLLALARRRRKLAA